MGVLICVWCEWICWCACGMNGQGSTLTAARSCPGQPQHAIGQPRTLTTVARRAATFLARFIAIIQDIFVPTRLFVWAAILLTKTDVLRRVTAHFPGYVCSIECS